MEKSVSSRYVSKLLTLSSAYYYQFLYLLYFIFLILSHPNKAIPIACIKIVVDCILVEPANAICPTLQFIFFIFSLSINYLDLSTFYTNNSSVFPYKIYGFLFDNYVDFQIAPITHGVYPPSVLPINISFSVNPNSISC